MKKETIRELCRKLKKKLHWKKGDQLSSITIIDGKVLLNGKPINKEDLRELVILFRINGM